MRIGVDARELQGQATGTGRYLRNLLRRWAGGGDTLILYFNGSPPAHAVPAATGVEARTVGSGRMRGLLWQQRHLPRAARGDGLDVFFSPAYTCPLRMATPRVTAVHDLSFFALPHEFALLDGMKRRGLVGASIAASRRVLACSDFTRREIAAWAPAAASRVRTVLLGADDDLPPAPPRAEARARLGLRSPLVLTVGSIFNRRCLPELLQALAILQVAVGEVRLEVVGENRSHPRLPLQRLARELGVHARVRFSGFLSDAELADRYAAADAAVFLSEYEGFGLGVLEAMARGLPVVASERPAMGELFAGAALLVNPREPAAVAAALARLLGRDDARRRDLVDRGRALASRFSWQDAAAATRSVLAEAAAEAR